jgi:hypothetical protein
MAQTKPDWQGLASSQYFGLTLQAPSTNVTAKNMFPQRITHDHDISFAHERARNLGGRLRVPSA